MVKRPQTSKSGRGGGGNAKPKTPKKTAADKKADREAKAAQKAADKAAKQAEAAKAAVGHNSVDPNMRALFLQHKPKIDRLLEQAQSANGKLRAALKEAKSDGFTKAQFDVARQLSTPEGEAEFKADIAKQLIAARYVGSDIGMQLDMFLETPRTDATERAYDEGQKAHMEGGARKPDYAPGTAQYEAWMKGFDDHKSGVAAGFKSLDTGAKPETERKRQQRAQASSEKPEAEKQQADAAGGEAPSMAPQAPSEEPGPTSLTSGQGLTRAEYTRLQQERAAQEQAQGESQFSRRN